MCGVLIADVVDLNWTPRDESKATKKETMATPLWCGKLTKVDILILPSRFASGRRGPTDPLQSQPIS